MTRPIASIVVLAVVLAALAVAQVSHRSDGGFSYLSPVNLTNVTYTGEYWDDTQVPALGIIPGATAPGLISFRTNDLLKIYGFDGAGAADYAYFTIQLSHRYKDGTPLHPHVHWCRTGDPDDPGNTNVVWRLVYSLGTPLGAFGLSVTNTITNGVAVANWTHQISGFEPITNETFGISGIMVGTITRVSADAGDTYTPDAGFLGFDLHFEVDAPGSREVYIK